MVVKKKVVKVSDKHGKIESPELTRVRATIQNINRDEGETVVATKKKVAPAKTAAPKENAKPKKAENADEDRVTLADLCTKYSLKPPAARRRLRLAEIERGDGRWAWKKGSKELAAVEAALKAPQE